MKINKRWVAIGTTVAVVLGVGTGFALNNEPVNNTQPVNSTATQESPVEPTPVVVEQPKSEVVPAAPTPPQAAPAPTPPPPPVDPSIALKAKAHEIITVRDYSTNPEPNHRENEYKCFVDAIQYRYGWKLDEAKMIKIINDVAEIYLSFCASLPRVFSTAPTGVVLAY